MMNDFEVRDELLKAARHLMLEKGYAATSVNEICQRVGVTKGAFFHYFPSKEALGRAVLHYHWEPMKEMLETTAPFLQIRDPLQRLRAHCRFIASQFDNPETPKSCLFGNFAQELSTTNPALCTLCDKVFLWWTDILKSDLDEAVKLYPPQIPVDTTLVAEHFVVVYEGMMILAKAQQNPDVIHRHIEQFIQYLNLLFGKKESDHGKSRKSYQD